MADPPLPLPPLIITTRAPSQRPIDPVEAAEGLLSHLLDPNIAVEVDAVDWLVAASTVALDNKRRIDMYLNGELSQ